MATSCTPAQFWEHLKRYNQLLLNIGRKKKSIALTSGFHKKKKKVVKKKRQLPDSCLKTPKELREFMKQKNWSF